MHVARKLFKSVAQDCRHVEGGQGAIAHRDRNTASILGTH